MTTFGVGRWRLLVVCLAGAIAAGGWAWWERRTSPALSAAELLETLPAVAGPSPTDKAVTL